MECNFPLLFIFFKKLITKYVGYINLETLLLGGVSVSV
uniref:Uncharacterized protein n=1 Tax=Arundo donax TaxID=35708 RepID=A0A0A9BG19_ARUDO